MYVIIVIWRARRQSAYQLVLEDWLWHIIFPFISYATFVIAAMMLPANPVSTLFCVGAATMLLLFIGIHNSWDTVTYVTIEQFKSKNGDQD